MDGNKDESARCVAIAQRAIDAGNIEKAVKFLRKAERLYPSKKAQGTFLGLFLGSEVTRLKLAISQRIYSSSHRIQRRPAFWEIPKYWI